MVIIAGFCLLLHLVRLSEVLSEFELDVEWSSDLRMLFDDESLLGQ